MHIVHLSLTNFRNYRHLDLELPPHVVVIQGDNTQGKTNLLEAIHFLATTKSPRASSDRELINQIALQEGQAVSRLLAKVHKAKSDIEIETVLKTERREPLPNGEEVALTVQKQIKVNGILRRVPELMGQVNVVMFTAQDIDLITGAPALRRRYLDLINSQLDARYLRLLQRYHRVLSQRNHLLRLISEHRAHPDQLEFWDKELVESGSYLQDRRQHIVTALRGLAYLIHWELSGGMEKLEIIYLPSIGEKGESHGQIKAEFWKALHQAREKEIDQGMSLVGPHRDDLGFEINEIDMSAYGSRSQQRTIALSLKLAEAKYINDQTGDQPVLLLDDVLSELDQRRRHHLLEFISPFQQVLITTTDLDRLEPWFLSQATQFRVNQGNIERV